MSFELHTYQMLKELKDEGFEHFANNGGYWLMRDKEGNHLNYDPRTDNIVPFAEQEEDY